MPAFIIIFVATLASALVLRGRSTSATAKHYSSGLLFFALAITCIGYAAFPLFDQPPQAWVVVGFLLAITACWFMLWAGLVLQPQQRQRWILVVTALSTAAVLVAYFYWQTPATFTPTGSLVFTLHPVVLALIILLFTETIIPSGIAMTGTIPDRLSRWLFIATNFLVVIGVGLIGLKSEFGSFIGDWVVALAGVALYLISIGLFEAEKEHHHHG